MPIPGFGPRAPLVGRQAEIATITRCLAASLQGAPQVLLFTGEPGIGKSRLLEETRALASGWQSMLGRAYDEAGQPPYAIWTEAFADLLQNAPPDRARALANDFPNLALIAPSLVPENAAVPTTGPQEAQRLQLFDNLTRFVERLAREAPLLMLLDDLHWADQASLELWRYLVTRIGPAPLLIVGATRDERTATSHAKDRAVEDINRQRRLMRAPVPRLRESETRRLVEALLGPAYAGLANGIHQSSEGNPFFAEEIARAIRREEGVPSAMAPIPAPPEIANVIELRLDRAGPTVRSLLETAAIAGRVFEPEIVSIAERRGLDECDRLFGEAAQYSLIRPAGEDQYEFVHDHIRDILNRGLSPLRRRSIHARIAEAIEHAGVRGDPRRSNRLAFHFGRARIPAKAVTYLIAAAEEAGRLHASAEAADRLREALQIVESAGLESPDRADLELRYGDAALAAGRESDAIASFRSAAREFQERGNQRLTASAFRRLGSAFARLEQPAEALAHYQQALSSVSALPGDAEEIQTLIQLGMLQGLTLAQYEQAKAAGGRALELAIAHGDRRLLAMARMCLANTLVRSGDLARSTTLLDEALAGALVLDDPILVAEVSGAQAPLRYWIGDLEGSAVATERRQRYALAGGNPYELRHVHSWFANIALSRGQWDEARRRLAAAEPIAARLESDEPRAFQQMMEGIIRFRTGQPAIAILEESMHQFRRIGPGTLIWYLGVLALAYIAEGETAAGRAALKELEGLIDALPAGSLPAGSALGQLGLGVLALNERDWAKRVSGLLRRHAGQYHWVLIDRVLGELALYMEDWKSAEMMLAVAGRRAAQAGMAPETAAVIAAQARLLRRRGGQAEAAALFQQAADLFDALGMVRDAALVRKEIASGAQPALQKAAASPAGLTAREREVLRLLAQGLTNRQIAERLAISEKTAINHVTHIFTKTNLPNRAAAISYAIRHGLADLSDA